jgi:outer membrane receptor protein involved in Fe transport
MFLIIPALATAQAPDGAIEGTLLDSVSRQAVNGASLELKGYNGLIRGGLSDKTGFFSFDSLPNDYYSLKISYVGLASTIMDSIRIYSDKKDVLLGEIALKPSVSNMDAIVIYFEKPLIQTKDGNIVMNVGESPLAASSTAADLLRNMPLVNTDPDGKVSVRGREPRILVDEKPVELNGQQLSDFLESFPGGMIDKIEVMTNPPPQYANEPGGVINITTRKGKVGVNGRVTGYGGTRGELGGNVSLSFRKKGLSMSFVAGTAYNEYRRIGNGIRENYYPDSSNALHTSSNNVNRSARPNARFSIEYDMNAKNNISMEVLYNGNDFTNNGLTTYRNFNTREELYRISERNIKSDGYNINPSMNLTYTHKGRKEGERLRIFLHANSSWDVSDKFFIQEFFDSKYVQTGPDSVQSQLNNTRSRGMNGRIAYDFPFNKGKTLLSTGGYLSINTSRVTLDSYYQLPTGEDVLSPALSSDLLFRQDIYNLRTSLRQQLSKGFHATVGLAWEATDVFFDIYSQQKNSSNSYSNTLPFFTINKSFENGVTMNASYRSSVRRPGIWEMNPAVDYTDPYNIRFGNPGLKPSTSHNFDFVTGKAIKKYYYNLGLGYNVVDDIFATVRTLIGSGKTTITWQNISAKKEYEISGWGGYQFSKTFRVNINGGYTYSVYSDYDIKINKYRNGGSVNSKVNFTYIPGDLWNISGSMNFNRYANPQGTVRSTVAMNFGLQRKLLQKKLLVTLNLVDPIIQQTYDNLTVGSNFWLMSSGITETRNFRLTLTYIFSVKKQ